MTDKNFIVKNGLSVGTAAVLDSSGDLVAGAFGTAAKEAIDDQVNALLTAGSGVSLTYDDAAGTLTVTRDAETGDISSVVAGGGLSGGGTAGDVTVALDLSELSAAAVDVANDSISIIDANDSNASKKESIADFVTAIAGTNITATNGVLSSTADVTGVTAGDGLSGGGTSGAISVALDLNELTAATVAVGTDSVAIIDANDSNASRKEAIADIITAVAGDALVASSGVLAVNVDDASIETNSDQIRVKAGGVSNAMLTSSSITINGSATALGGTRTLDSDDIGEGSSNLYHTTERVADAVGAMVAGNTETNITVTYEDSDNTLDFVIGTLNQSTTGNAATATALATARTIHGVSFDGSANISLTEEVQDTAGAMFTGNTETGITATYQDGDGTIDLVVDTSAISETLTNKTLTSPVINTGVSGTAILDEDAMGSNSATKLATQQSIKAYVDATAQTTEEVQDIVGAMFSSNTETAITATYQDGDGTIDLVVSNTDSITEGSTNLYHTTARARAAVSVTDAGGDGSLAYNSTSGVITYTGGSAAETRAHLSAGTGVTYSGGAFSIGQAVATSSDVTFADLILTGDLTVNGATVTNSATNTTIEDALIELGSGNTGANSNDLGLILERGSTGNNAFMGWDESADSFVLGTTTATGASTGGLTIATAALSVGATTITNATNAGGTARNVYQSTSAPAGGDGAIGDLWILYS